MTPPKRPKSKEQPSVRDFNYNNYRSGNVFGAHLPIGRGYNVRGTGTDPANKSANGVFINPKGEKIEFYIEEIESTFEMTGSTAQSQQKREFYPHNFVQPSVTVRGIAPNSFEYNRLAQFVRISHKLALNSARLREQGVPIRTLTTKSGTFAVPTLKLIIKNGTGDSALTANKFPYSGRTVKGRHKTWVLEGYVKSMPAGAQRHDPTPKFEFEFMIAESQQNGANVGLWDDTAVMGNDIKPWIDIFKSRGKNGFIRQGRLTSPDFTGEDAQNIGNDIGEAVGDVGASAQDLDVDDYVDPWADE